MKTCRTATWLTKHPPAAMSTARDPNDTPERRASVRRTVWVLVGVAGLVYGYFIVKTFIAHSGGAA